MARNQKTSQLLTTAQRLSSIVKACRDIMRKDKGLSTDIDRLPMLTWIMFLKFLDDNLSIKNPSGAEDLKHLPPARLVEDILAKEQRIIDIMGEIKAVLTNGGTR